MFKKATLIAFTTALVSEFAFAAPLEDGSAVQGLLNDHALAADTPDSDRFLSAVAEDAAFDKNAR